MSPLQWALLILGGLAIIALYVFSRRDRRAMERPDPAGHEPLVPAAATGKERKQLDIFNTTDQQFDEFGVGKPRRITPTFEQSFEESEDGMPPPLDPALFATARKAEAPAPAAPLAGKEKIISLLIAERDGAHIAGTQVHQALAAQRLAFGTRQIYHRLHKGKVVFSVASLLKPGTLDPNVAATFSTPGLALFMVLPGPQRPADALRDMLGTAEKLAKALNAEVYDAKRAPFTAEAARTLGADVDAWARSK